jgi:hypothetical protein
MQICQHSSAITSLCLFGSGSQQQAHPRALISKHTSCEAPFNLHQLKEHDVDLNLSASGKLCILGTLQSLGMSTKRHNKSLEILVIQHQAVLAGFLFLNLLRDFYSPNLPRGGGNKALSETICPPKS